MKRAGVALVLLLVVGGWWLLRDLPVRQPSAAGPPAAGASDAPARPSPLEALRSTVAAPRDVALPESDGPVPSAARVRVLGRVRDSDGRGVVGARLEGRRVPAGRLGDEVLSGVSATDGSFELGASGGGALTLRVRADGWAPASVELELPEQGRVAIEDVVLVPGARLRGSVASGDGRPVAGALVAALGGLWMPEDVPSALGRAQATAITTSAGDFEFPALSADLRFVAVVAEGFPAAAIEIPPLDVGEARDVVLTLPPGAILTGEVEGPGPAPGQRWIVHASPNAPRAVESRSLSLTKGLRLLPAERETAVDSLGAFRFDGLLHGAEYLLQARLRDDSGLDQPCSEPVVARGGATNIRLPRRPDTRVRFTVRDARTGQGLEHARVRCGIGWLRDADSGGFRLQREAGGVCVISLRVPPGRDDFALEISLPGYVTETRTDRVVLPEGLLELGSIPLTPAPILRVRVQDAAGQPVTGAELQWAVLVPGESRAEHLRRGLTASNGECVATDETPQHDLQLRVEAPGHAPHERSVAPSVDGAREVLVQLESGAELAVRLLAAPEVGAPRRLVEHRRPAGAEPLAEALGSARRERLTDEKGWAVFADLPAGEHDVRAARSRREADTPAGAALAALGLGQDSAADEGWVRVSLSSDERLEVALSVGAAAHLAGEVRMAGRALAGARVELAPEHPGIALRDLGEKGRRVVTTDTQGRFALAELECGPWSWRLEHAARALPERGAVRLEPGPNVLELRLEDGQLEGRVTCARDTAIAGAAISVFAPHDWTHLPAGLTFAFADPASGRVLEIAPAVTAPRARTDDAGRFTLSGLPLGRPLQIAVEHPGYVRAVADAFELSPQAPRKALEIRLEPAGQVEIRILSSAGLPLGFARCQLTRPLGAPPAPERRALVGASGVALVEGLAEGPWTVAVEWLNAAPGAEAPPPHTVEVAGGATATAVFVLPR